MAIKLIPPLAAALATMLFAQTVAAQSSSFSSQSSTTTSAGGDEVLGAEGQALAEGVPELKKVDRAKLRDKSIRGGFVGADSGGAGFFDGMSQGGDRTGDRTGRSRWPQRPRSRGFHPQRGPQFQPGRSRGTTLRPRLALGFHYTPKVSPRLAENMQMCIKRIPSLNGTSPVRISVQQNVVVLEGTVASAHDRALSAQLVALSPGVCKIDNRLKVAAADSPSP